MGGLFGRPLQIPPNVASGDYLKRVYEAGHVKPYFDGVALHPYVAEAKAMGPELDNFRRIMRNFGDSRTPIYVTELGWGSHSGPTRWQRGPQGQADQLSRAFEMLSANRVRWKVDGVWWFTWTDEGGTCIFCGSAGLLTDALRSEAVLVPLHRMDGRQPGSGALRRRPRIGASSARAGAGRRAIREEPRWIGSQEPQISHEGRPDGFRGT